MDILAANNRLDKDRPLRILIITHAPLSLEFGAGQMAINLGEAFKQQGHNVTLWSSCYAHTRRFNILSLFQDIRDAQRRIDLFLDSEDSFDIIDCPGRYISKKMLNSGAKIVSRSVQPDISYLIADLLEVKSFRNFIIKPLYFVDVCLYIFYLIQGWQRANLVLCLGSLEFEWMKKYFPWFKHKLNFYVNALANNERELLSKIRLQRQQLDLKSRPIDFLWIGRWAPHKGTTTLIKFMLERLNLQPHDSFTIAGCGSGADRDIPIQLIQSGQVKIIPQFNRDDLFSLLAKHDVGLFTSKSEGWGLVLNEMLESGMTVYATYTGGVADMRNYCPEKLGTFPPPVEISIVDSNSCDWQKYDRKFTWSGIADRYLEIYRDSLTQNIA